MKVCIKLFSNLTQNILPRMFLNSTELKILYSGFILIKRFFKLSLSNFVSLWLISMDSFQYIFLNKFSRTFSLNTQLWRVTTSQNVPKKFRSKFVVLYKKIKLKQIIVVILKVYLYIINKFFYSTQQCKNGQNEY